jgi:hypothetical protein
LADRSKNNESLHWRATHYKINIFLAAKQHTLSLTKCKKNKPFRWRFAKQRTKYGTIQNLLALRQFT